MSWTSLLCWTSCSLCSGELLPLPNRSRGTPWKRGSFSDRRHSQSRGVPERAVPELRAESCPVDWRS